MIGLNRQMSRKGVVAAEVVAEDGRIVRAVGELSRDGVERVARLRARHQRATRDIAVALGLGTELDWRHLLKRCRTAPRRHSEEFVVFAMPHSRDILTSPLTAISACAEGWGTCCHPCLTFAIL
jgi:hypothetical protein